MRGATRPSQASERHHVSPFNAAPLPPNLCAPKPPGAGQAFQFGTPSYIGVSRRRQESRQEKIHMCRWAPLEAGRNGETGTAATRADRGRRGTASRHDRQWRGRRRGCRQATPSVEPSVRQAMVKQRGTRLRDPARLSAARSALRGPRSAASALGWRGER